MLNRIVIAGQKALDHWDLDLVQKMDKGNDLCRIQERQSAQGRVGVEVVKSLYGWSVRYDSGLQDFGLLASSRHKDVDGTLEDAIRYATNWVNEDPSKRYAWMRPERPNTT